MEIKKLDEISHCKRRNTVFGRCSHRHRGGLPLFSWSRRSRRRDKRRKNTGRAQDARGARPRRFTPSHPYVHIYTQTPIGTIRESPLFFFNLFFFFFYSRVFFSLFLVAVLRIPSYERLGTWKFFFFFPFLNFSRECLTLDRALLDVNFSFRSFATLIKAWRY